MTMIVDPPSGWQFGFPRAAPDNIWSDEFDAKKWFLDNGYPQKLIDQGMLDHCRYWYEDKVV